jgi:hypothetical protein
MGYDPKEIVLEVSCVKSLRQREIQLKNSCKNLEFRLSLCKEVLPLCEQIMRLELDFQNYWHSTAPSQRRLI